MCPISVRYSAGVAVTGVPSDAETFRCPYPRRAAVFVESPAVVGPCQRHHTIGQGRQFGLRCQRLRRVDRVGVVHRRDDVLGSDPVIRIEGHHVAGVLGQTL